MNTITSNPQNAASPILTAVCFIVIALSTSPPAFAAAESQQQQEINEDFWAVRWANGNPDRQALEKLGLLIEREVENLDRVFVVRPVTAEAIDLLESRRSSRLRPHQRRESFLRDHWRNQGLQLPDLLWADPVEALPASTAVFPNPGFGDPRVAAQWHLHNTGQSGGRSGEDANLYQAWLDGYSGKSVVIGIVDEGIDQRHEEFLSNFRADLSRDFVNGGTDPSPRSENERHGMAVAGVAAAAQNGLGGVGVAFDAGIASLRALDDRDNFSFVTNTTMASVLNHRNQDIHVYNNSWGYRPTANFSQVGFVNTTAQALFQDSLAKGVREGRGGLGAVYVWAAGNSNLEGDRVNLDQIVSSPFTIAVGAVGDSGRHATYSNRGAALHLVAPSSGSQSGIVTADRYVNGISTYQTGFGGTSAAAPIVSGVIALMLEANPQLTWRDIQHILLSTAVQIDRAHPDWKLNGVGRPVNHTYGFGRVDAAAAVRLAAGWTTVGLAIEAFEPSSQSPQGIPQNPATPLRTALTIEKDVTLEHVQLSLTLEDGSRWDNLRVALISPLGTESILLEPFNSVNAPDGDSWLFTTLRTWGESARGEWVLDIRNTSSREPPGGIVDWGLLIRGTPQTGEAPSSFEAPEPVRFTSLETSGSVEVLAANPARGTRLLSLYRSPGGEAWIEGENRIRVRVDDAFRGTLEIPYTIAQANGRTRVGLLRWVNPRPIARANRIGTLAGAPRSLFPLENDEHPDDQSLSIASFTQPANGRVSRLNGSALLWTPEDIAMEGNVSFSYTIVDEEGELDSAEVELFTPDREDFAVRFSGLESFASVESNSNLNLRNAMTLEAWIFPEDYGALPEAGFGRIIDKEMFLLFLSENSPFYAPGALVFYLRQEDGSTAARFTNPQTIPLNSWTHVAATYDGGETVRFYINGQPATANDPALNVGSPRPDSFGTLRGPLQDNFSNPLLLGQNREQTRGFRGIIDEVRVWNRVRSGAEIARDFENPLFGFESGLVGYWPMVSGRGQRLVERSGRGNDATLQDADWDGGRVDGLARDRFTDSRFLNAQWRASPWLGLFFEDRFDNWFYHRDHGWLFAAGDSADFLHLYDPSLETWFWTTRSLYPFLYRYDRQRWVYFDTRSNAARFFFDFETNSWEAVAKPQQ